MSDSMRADEFMHQLYLAEKKLKELGYEYNGENYTKIYQNSKCNGLCSDPITCTGGCYEY